jgi:hypothetical protein
VVPLSPVRVAIWVSRLDIRLQVRKKTGALVVAPNR